MSQSKQEMGPEKKRQRQERRLPYELERMIGLFLTNQEQSMYVAASKDCAGAVQPKRLLAALLSYVVKGNQDAAEKMIIHTLVRRDPLLLRRTGHVTDYSGRTFKGITAYEYAWWAKDKHMLMMLESHMDADTKAFTLKRIDALEAHGLTY
jgi:hypothetical protein